jgi:hypothetical protein
MWAAATQKAGYNGSQASKQAERGRVAMQEPHAGNRVEEVTNIVLPSRAITSGRYVQGVTELEHLICPQPQPLPTIISV